MATLCLSLSSSNMTMTQCKFSQSGVEARTAQSPDLNTSDTFGMNWTTHSEPDMISQHQYWTSLMLLWLNGSESLQKGSTSAGKAKTMPVLSMLSVHALMGIFSMCLLHSFVLVFGMVTSSAANRSMSWKAEEKICWQTCLTCPNNFRTGLDDLTDNETFVLSFFHVFMALESEFKYIYVNIQSSLTLQARLF